MRKSFVTLAVGLIIFLISSCSSGKKTSSTEDDSDTLCTCHRKVSFILTFNRLETSPRRKQIN